jgi:hypothetical protein
MEASTSQAHARWELENQVQTEDDALLKYDAAEQAQIRQQMPWKNDPRYFKKCAHFSCLVPCGRISTSGKGVSIC